MCAVRVVGVTGQLSLQHAVFGDGTVKHIVIMLASGPALGSWLATALLIVTSLPFLCFTVPSPKTACCRLSWPVTPTTRTAAAGGCYPAFGKAEQGFVAHSECRSPRRFA